MCEKNKEYIINSNKNSSFPKNNINQEILNILDIEYSISKDINDKINILTKSDFLELYEKVLIKSLTNNYHYIELIVPKFIKIWIEKKYFLWYDFHQKFLDYFVKIYTSYEDDKFFIRDVVPSLLEIDFIINDKRVIKYFEEFLEHIFIKLENFIKIYQDLSLNFLDMKKRIQYEKLKYTEVYKYYITDLIPMILELDIKISEIKLENFNKNKVILEKIYYINN